MKITIVYDNSTLKPGLIADWGFASLIETDDAPPILFDTGADGATLLNNMQKLGIAPDSIGVIVISHRHGDHTGGLSEIMELNEHAVIYLPASIGGRLPGRKVISVSQPVSISETVFSIGELNSIEQSLAVKTGKGILVVTGCSHPGVGAILDAASQHGTVYGIIGGFHGFREFSRLEGLSLVCPCHCTQYTSEIQGLFPDQYVACGAGLELEL
jgi:7,8-dihydropterin-6-yl-methyl-4-(beta-D-ribofuranosyl)aminobenzene 5'-phosphate synthase